MKFGMWCDGFVVADCDVFEDGAIADGAVFAEDAASYRAVGSNGDVVEEDGGVDGRAGFDGDVVAEAGVRGLALDGGFFSGEVGAVSIGEEAAVDVEVRADAADVDPVAGELVAVEAVGVIDDAGEDFFFHADESVGFDVVQDGSFEEVGAGVDEVGGCVLWFGFFDEVADFSVGVDFDDAVFGDVVHRPQGDGGHRVVFVVGVEHVLEVDGGDDVGVEDEEAAGDVFVCVFDGAAGAQGPGFLVDDDGLFEVEGVDVVLYLVAAIVDGEDDGVDFRGEAVEDVGDHGFVQDG